MNFLLPGGWLAALALAIITGLIWRSTGIFAEQPEKNAVPIAGEYPYINAEPQRFGWPLTEAEREFVLKPEHVRRPGSEVMKYQAKLWPVVPSAGFWSGTS